MTTINIGNRDCNRYRQQDGATARFNVSGDVTLTINMNMLVPLINKALTSKTGVTKLQGGGITIKAINRKEVPAP